MNKQKIKEIFEVNAEKLTTFTPKKKDYISTLFFINCGCFYWSPRESRKGTEDRLDKQ
jgi:hypothetical protein